MTGRWRVTYWMLALAVCGTLVGCPAVDEGDPTILVMPAALNFGTAGETQSIAIVNNGGGVLGWTIQSDIPWLDFDLTTGTVGANIQRVALTVDRTGVDAGTYTDTFQVVTTVGTRTVYVAMSVAGPAGEIGLAVSPLTVNMLDTEETATFVVSNTGTGAFTWGLQLFDPDDEDDPDTAISTPDWLDFSWPSGGSTVAPGGETTVTITVDRDTITEGIYGYLIEISSGEVVEQVALNVVEGLSPEIGVEPDVLDFGTTGTVLSFDVFNTGAVGSVLEFTLSTDRPDLIAIDLAGDPPSGVSVGTEDSDNYDRVAVPVTIIRSAMTGETDGGTITVEADGLDPVEIIVNVEAAPLTFEGAQNRTRPPFILRFIFLLRDSLGETIDTTDEAVFAELQDAFTVYEDGEVLDPDESNIFVTSADNLRYNLILMLDFTGSMYNAGAGGGAEIDQMKTSAADFINDLFEGDPTKPPRSYRVAIMEYHERQQTSRIIHGFSTDPDSLTEALENFSLSEADHGASEVRDALVDACDRLAAEDAGVISFDDADVRAVVFISDGRDTSSITGLGEIIDQAEEQRVRLYPIGFGEEVNASDLVQMATETGGHYYPAPTRTDLVSLLEQEEGAPVNSDGVIVKELTRQIVLTYVSLFQDGSHTYLIKGEYDGVEGSFQRDGVFALGGVVRAGQISLRTAGIDSGGTAQLYVRTEYVPRGITEFRIRLLTAEAYTLEIDPNGIISDWFLIDEGSGVYTALTTADNPLQYGYFGNLFLVNFTGLAPGSSYEVGFRGDNRVYLDPGNTKFFQYPDDITISDESSQASVVPLLESDGFDPDDPDAFDRDLDGVDDFEDLYPDDPDQS